jgi:hypothetical protein
MKSHTSQICRACTVSLIIVGVVAAEAEQPRQLAPAGSLSISAKTVASAASALYYWVASWGSYDRDFFAQQDVEIEAHNLSRFPAKIAVDFYFVGRPEYKPEPRILFSRRSFTIDVPAAYQKRVSLKSDVLKSSEQRYVALNEQHNSGYQIAGWFLQARVPTDTRPFANASSEPAWLERMDWFLPALARFTAAVPQDGSGGPARQLLSPSPLPSKPAAEATHTPLQDSMKKRQPTMPASPNVVLTSDVAVRLAYGQMTLRKGTKLIVVSRTQEFVSVRCGDEVIDIPVTDTAPQ